MIDMLKDHLEKIGTVLAGCLPVAVWFGSHKSTHEALAKKCTLLHHNIDDRFSKGDKKFEQIMEKLDALTEVRESVSRIEGYLQGKNGAQL